MGSSQTQKKQIEFPTTNWTWFIQKREADCMEELAKKYWKPLYFYIRKKYGYSHLHAEEVVQELFWTLLNEPEMFDNARPEKGRFRHFLLGILKNISKDVKKENRTPFISFGLLITKEEEELLLLSYSAEDLFNLEWARLVVDEALKKLKRYYCGKTMKSEKLKAYIGFKLKYLEGKKIYDIAEQLRCDPEWLSDKIYRLKKQFQKCLRCVIQETISLEENVNDEIQELMRILSKPYF